jgi:putative Mn2+ efflux pump MntP
MNVIQWAESKSHALTIWDTGLLKATCILLGMVIGAHSSSLVTAQVEWFVAGVLILGGIYGVRWFTVGSSHR